MRKKGAIKNLAIAILSVLVLLFGVNIYGREMGEREFISAGAMAGANNVAMQVLHWDGSVTDEEYSQLESIWNEFVAEPMYKNAMKYVEATSPYIADDDITSNQPVNKER